MEHSEEYYKMKYFKYKAKYTKEKLRIQQSGGSLVGNAIAKIIEIPIVALYQTGKAVGNKISNALRRVSPEDKQNALVKALEYLKKNNINADDIKTNYKKIKKAIENIKGDDINKKKILNALEVCHSMFRDIDNECIKLKK